MLRSTGSRSALAIAIAVLWSAAMVGFAMIKETPVGTVQGRVAAAETRRPIEDAYVYLREKTDDDSGKSRYVTTDKMGRFRFPNVPTGDYTIQAEGKVHHMEEEALLVAEGKVRKLDLRLEPSEPDFNLYANQQTFTSKEMPEVILDGFTRGSAISLAINRVNLDRFFNGDKKSIQRILSGFDVKSFLEPYEKRKIKITKRDSEGSYHQKIGFGHPKPGIYVLEASVDGIRRSTWFSVSDLGIITKENGSDFLVFAVRPDTGKAVSGAEVKVWEGKGEPTSGVTDRSGIWKTSFPKTTGAPPNRLIIARYGNSTAFVNAEWYEEVSGSTTIYAYTDRPVYRPGHVVRFKGIARDFQGDSYRLPRGGTAAVEVRDRRNTLVYSGELPLNRFGSFHGQFKLPEYAATGGYDLSCTYGGQEQTATFQVAEYRKPEFTVSVEMPKKRCARGEVVRAKIKADYYFGAPVAGAEVRYSVSRSSYWFSTDEEEDFDGYYDYGGYGETVREGNVRTDADGTATVEFPTSWESDQDGYGTSDQEFTVSATVTDQSHRSSEGEGTIIATQGDIRLSVRSQSYVVNPKESARFLITAEDYDRKPQGSVNIDVSAFRVEWKKNKEERIPAGGGDVRTDPSGKAAYTFKPDKPGSYAIKASCRDRSGRLIEESEWLWVAGEGEYEGYNYPDLELVLDKKTYDPGDTAKLLINTSEKDITALLSIEGRRIYDYRILKLSDKSSMVLIPIASEMKPNFYVDVCYIKDKRFVSQEARARVTLNAETINLTVRADKKRYEPGETANYLVRAVDSHGDPVQAEVSLGVIDEAIYQIQPDETTPIKDFFYGRRPNSVRTRYSFPEVYLSADKAGFTGKVRKEFVDTAYWQADLVTDENGEARASFKMPDNLTTWRATARACSVETTVGQCTSSVVVSKKLLVRLETPRFLVQGDRAIITAIVHNYTPKDQRVRVALKAEGVDVTGPLETTVDVSKDGAQPVTWEVQAREVGEAKFTAYAVSPQAQDAMELSIPVRPHGQRVTEHRTGTVSNAGAELKLNVSPDAVSGASEIRLRLAPSLASTMLGSLDYLAQYPYGCTEQTMSKFLPDVVIWRTLKTLNMENPDLAKRLPDMIGKGLDRLYDSQNENGGWGWCEYGKEDTWMTAYVVYGLVVAQRGGFEVNKDVLDNGMSALQRQVSKELKPKEDIHDRLFGLYVLSTAGKAQVVEQRLDAVLKRGVASPEELALAAMTLDNIGQRDQAQGYLARMWQKAVLTGGEIHWGSEQNFYDFFSPPTETTATALMAAVQLAPDDPRIPQVIRWLISQRLYDHWYSTRDTASVLYALSEYLRHTNELQPDFTATVSANGEKVESIRFDEKSVFQPEREIVIGSNKVQPGENVIRIETSGPGTLYYTAALTQYVDRGGRPFTGRSGIRVERSYFKLVSRWDGSSNSTRLMPARSSTTDFGTGDPIRVRLVINSPREYHRLIVEDYLPAGCEAFDLGRLSQYEWDYWYVDKDVRDERVTFYIDTLPKGKSVLEYEFRPSTPGTYRAMPTLVQAMYDPSIEAGGAEDEVRIR